MDSRTEGIILRTRPLTETSLIVNWITAEFGRISTVAKGARRPKSAFRGKLDLFYAADFSFTQSHRSTLHTLKEISLTETHPALRHELPRLTQASYASMLLVQCTESETPIPEIYKAFTQFLDALNRTEIPNDLLVPAFEIKLLAHLGMEPQWGDLQLPLPTRELGRQLGGVDWIDLSKLRPQENTHLQLEQFLHGFMIHHLGRIPAGRNKVTLRGGSVKRAE